MGSKCKDYKLAISCLTYVGIENFLQDQLKELL